MAEKRLAKIARDLRKAGFSVESQPTVSGVRPDLLVKTPDDRHFVVEVKAWSSRPGFAARAADQAKHYAELLDADGSFVVLDELKRNYGAHVVTPDGLLPAIDRWLGELPPSKRRRKRARKRTAKMVFAAMPFKPEYDDVFFVAMAEAAKTVGAACKRVDHEDFAGDILAEIKRLVRSSRAIIADVSESRPNVLYEMGLAEAMRKPILQVCSTPLNELPFDIRQNKTIPYTRGQTHLLKRKLAKWLRPFVEGAA